MPRADWTYEVPPAGADAAGLEEYVVVDSGGSHVGKVMTLLRRGDEMFVAVEAGTPPVNHDPRAFRWEDVDDVDHTALTVRLKLAGDDLADALELDPGKGTEKSGADAERVTELPPELRQTSAPAGGGGEGGGPTDKPSYLVSFALGALGIFSFLIVAIVATATEFTWQWALFMIPAVLLVLAGVTGYRLFRNPYQR